VVLQAKRIKEDTIRFPSTETSHGDVAGNHSKAWGVYVGTFDSGDKIFYTYQATATMKDDAIQTGQNKYQITDGTGKMKGINGSGTCKNHRQPRWRLGLFMHW
jgi:hypothetical protein